MADIPHLPHRLEKQLRIFEIVFAKRCQEIEELRVVWETLLENRFMDRRVSFGIPLKKNSVIVRVD